MHTWYRLSYKVRSVSWTTVYMHIVYRTRYEVHRALPYICISCFVLGTECIAPYRIIHAYRILYQARSVPCTTVHAYRVSYQVRSVSRLTVFIHAYRISYQARSVSCTTVYAYRLSYQVRSVSCTTVHEYRISYQVRRVSRLTVLYMHIVYRTRYEVCRALPYYPCISYVVPGTKCIVTFLWADL